MGRLMLKRLFGLRTGYKAFISYSHAADNRLAPELEKALQRFARPWYRPVTYRVFRDETGFGITENMWRTITEAMRVSEYLILLASPDAAASKWVQREAEYWIDELKRPARTVLLVLTSGPLLHWDEAAKSFSPSSALSLPPGALTIFRQEPKFVDLRWARDPGIDLSLHNNKFRDNVADIAHVLLGVSKSEVIGEEVRQRRIVQALAASAVTLLTVLAAVATWKAIQAQRRLADANSRRLAIEAISQITSNPDLALLLAVGAYDTKPTTEARDALLAAEADRPRLKAML